MDKTEDRKAIASHSTDTVSEAWDGPGNKARLKLDQAGSYYRKAFAWQDPEKDETNKSSWKFVHHMVTEDGSIGAANTRACTSGIGVLNGGRGGTTIPDEDRQGVWNHLARHLRDADIEPPALARAEDLPDEVRQPFGEVEIRTATSLEIRASDQDGKMPHIVGYAAKFEQLSEPIWFFREKIRRGAFNKSLLEYDQRAFWNHDTGDILGRVSAGTLALKEDDAGLWVDIDPPDSPDGRSHVESIRRGDVKGMSFGFQAVREEWDNEDSIRTLVEVKLFEISPTPIPAYPTTSAQIRSMFPRLNLDIDPDAMAGLLMRARRGAGLTAEDAEKLRGYCDVLRGMFPAGFAPDTTSAPAEGHPDDGTPAEGHLPNWGRSVPSIINARLQDLESQVSNSRRK